MKNFHIEYPDEGLREALIDKINNLTKPKGSLGVLEDLALQIGLIQQTLSPTLSHPHNVLFAADHGIVEEGVSKSPKEITWQQLSNFLHGGAGVNFLCRQHGFKLVLVDSGVDYDLPYEKGIINCSVGRGTHSFLKGPAMSMEEMELCLERGAKITDMIHADGCNVVSFGEMGIGNTSPSSVWMHLLTGISLEQCVGAGSGLDSEGIRHKYNVLKQSVDHYAGDGSAKDIIAWFGGYEMVMAIGGMLRAAELRMIILVDGFIMTNCILAASKLHPEVLSYAIFGHQGDEIGHKLVLDAMKGRPLLNLGLRLGEGTGAICAYPIVVSSVNMMNSADSHGPVPVFLQSHESFVTAAERMHVSAYAQMPAFFQYPEKVLRGIPFMDVYRQVQFRRKLELRLQCPSLQLCTIFRIMIVQPYFSDCYDIMIDSAFLDLLHFFFPILLHGTGVQARHVPENFRKPVAKFQHSVPFAAVNVRLQDDLHPGGQCPAYNFFLLALEGRIVQMRVRIYKYVIHEMCHS